MFRVTEFNARLAPALIGVLTIPILFFQSARCWSGSSLLASLFLALNPWHCTGRKTPVFTRPYVVLYPGNAGLLFWDRER